MEEILIKKVSIQDVSALQKISRQTFFETFSQQNSAEDMNKYLETGFSMEQLDRELKDTNSEFYFAMLNNEVIGYLKINSGPAQTELKDTNSFEIERIYVLNDFHGKKVGQLLYKKALEVATQKNVEYLWLGVWEKNLRAINFYRKNGFVEFDKHVFKLGDDEQIDIMMRLKL
jgi:ribosomal protein S18 acetylase RimI-like enzyme